MKVELAHPRREGESLLRWLLVELKPGGLPRRYTRRAKGAGERINDYRRACIHGARENSSLALRARGKCNKKKVWKYVTYTPGVDS